MNYRRIREAFPGLRGLPPMGSGYGGRRPLSMYEQLNGSPDDDDLRLERAITRGLDIGDYDELAQEEYDHIRPTLNRLYGDGRPSSQLTNSQEGDILASLKQHEVERDLADETAREIAGLQSAPLQSAYETQLSAAQAASDAIQGAAEQDIDWTRENLTGPARRAAIRELKSEVQNQEGYVPHMQSHLGGAVGEGQAQIDADLGEALAANQLDMQGAQINALSAQEGPVQAAINQYEGAVEEGQKERAAEAEAEAQAASNFDLIGKALAERAAEKKELTPKKFKTKADKYREGGSVPDQYDKGLWDYAMHLDTREDWATFLAKVADDADGVNFQDLWPLYEDRIAPHLGHDGPSPDPVTGLPGDELSVDPYVEEYLKRMQRGK